MFGVGEAFVAVRLAGGVSVFDFLQAAVEKRSREIKKTEMDRYLFMLFARVELSMDVLKGTVDKISNDE
jgi:hypothetical protein